jgi:hypothetical protein
MQRNQVSNKKYISLCFQLSYRVLVFKDAPILVYTGLTRAIGKPKDMEKIEEENGKYFDSDFDISIPIENTNEYKKTMPQENLVVLLIINDI